jgi:ATP-binding cassette subfamily G (WHITE) protein 2 (SNQ2)
MAENHAGSYHGNPQYDPTYNPYSSNAAHPIMTSSSSMYETEPVARSHSSGEATAVSSGSSEKHHAHQSQGQPLAPQTTLRSEEPMEEYEEEYETNETPQEAYPSNHEHAAEAEDHVPEMMPIKAEKEQRPGLSARSSSRRSGSQYGLMPSLSKRWTQETKHSKQGGHEEEMEEIKRLLTQMFGKERREHSEEEKTRHVGLVWKSLTVKGAGLGASVQETLSTPFVNLKTLFTKGPKALKHKPPVRTLIDNFTGCLRPGEMCLVLGRPGSGCSTFLKVLANQRSGYEDVEGDVTYGGTDAARMQKHFRGDIICKFTLDGVESVGANEMQITQRTIYTTPH